MISQENSYLIYRSRFFCIFIAHLISEGDNDSGVDESTQEKVRVNLHSQYVFVDSRVMCVNIFL